MFVLACVCTEVLRPTSQRPQRTVFFPLRTNQSMSSWVVKIWRSNERTVEPILRPCRIMRIEYGAPIGTIKKKGSSANCCNIGSLEQKGMQTRRRCRRVFIYSFLIPQASGLRSTGKESLPVPCACMNVCVCVCVSAVEYWLKINA